MLAEQFGVRASCAACVVHIELTRERIFWLFEVLWRLFSKRFSLKLNTFRWKAVQRNRQCSRKWKVSDKTRESRESGITLLLETFKLKVLRLKPVPNSPFERLFRIEHQANWFRVIFETFESKVFGFREQCIFSKDQIRADLANAQIDFAFVFGISSNALVTD